MKKTFLMVIFLPLFTTGCASIYTSSNAISDFKPKSVSDEETRNLLIGTWQGSQSTKEGGKREELCTRYPNGTYETEFLSFDAAGVVSKQKEVGVWGVSGSIYFSIFSGWVIDGRLVPADRSDSYSYDAYDIISLDGDVFVYKHVRIGDEYRVKRVSKAFTLDDDKSHKQ